MLCCAILYRKKQPTVAPDPQRTFESKEIRDKERAHKKRRILQAQQEIAKQQDQASKASKEESTDESGNDTDQTEDADEDEDEDEQSSSSSDDASDEESTNAPTEVQPMSNDDATATATVTATASSNESEQVKALQAALEKAKADAEAERQKQKGMTKLSPLSMLLLQDYLSFLICKFSIVEQNYKGK